MSPTELRMYSFNFMKYLVDPFIFQSSFWTVECVYTFGLRTEHNGLNIYPHNAKVYYICFKT
jgi:hypothetical protein